MASKQVGVSLFRAYLASSLADGGSETVFYLSTIESLTGESIATADFSVFGRGILTIDPLSSTNIEICSFTGVNSTSEALTGGIRGLSTVGDDVSVSRAKYHPVGTLVIISFGIHNIADLKAYVDSAIAGTLGTSSDTSNGSTKLTQGMGAVPRAKHALVSQQSSPNMTLYVQPFSFVGNGSLNINFAGGNTPTITAPSANPRIDLVVYETSSSEIKVRTGTEAASPSRPNPTTNDIVLCSVYNTVGETSLKERTDGVNGYIQQWYEISQYNTSSYVDSSVTFVEDVDQEQTTQNGTTKVGEANATGKQSLLAQSFLPTINSIRGVKLYRAADTGTFAGTVTVSLKADSSGSPTGSDLASRTLTNAEWALIPVGVTEIDFTTEYNSLDTTKSYWIVIATSTSDNSNHPNLGTNTAGGYANGSVKYNNSTDGWVAIATIDLYFKTLAGIVQKFFKTDTEGLVPSAARASRVLAITITPVTVSGTSETTVFSALVPKLAVDTGFRLKFTADLASTSTAGTSITVKLKLNGSAFYSFVAVTTSAGASNSGFIGNIDAIILNNNSTSAQNIQIYMARYLELTTNGTICLPYLYSTSTIDTSTGGIFEITFTKSHDTDVTASLKQALLERMS